MTQGSFSSPPTIDPTEFFERHLPALFEEGGARSDREARIIFEIGGAKGGRWAIDMKRQPEVHSVDLEITGSLLVRLDAAIFPNFVDGTLDVAAAVHKGELLFAGDLSLLDDLAEMWRPPLDPLSLRVQEARR